MVDTTIYGFIVNDCETVHPDCLTEGDTISARLYYLDDTDPFGMSCDGCGLYIFEPADEHPFVVDTKWSTPGYPVCRECGNREDEAPHTTDEMPDEVLFDLAGGEDA